MATHKPSTLDHILIWEDDILGHAPEYVIGSAITYKNEGHTVSICTADNRRIIERLDDLGISTSTFNYIESSKIRLSLGRCFPSLTTRLSRSLSIVRDYYRAKSTSKNRTLLYLPTIHAVNFSQYKYIFDLFNVSWSGLYLNASNFRVDPSSESATILRLFRSRNLNSLYTIDPLAVGFIQTTLKIDQVFFRPDFAYICKNLCADLLQTVSTWTAGRKLGLHAGMLTARKGIAEFAKLIDEHDESQYCFVVAGRLSTSELSETEMMLVEATWNRTNVMVINRSLQQSEFDTLLSLADFVFCCYRDWTQGSNVMIRAGLLDKPVITRKGYLCDEVCTQYNLGASVNPSAVKWTEITEDLLSNLRANPTDNLVEVYSPLLIGNVSTQSAIEFPI
jgi:hypothetical protein